MFEKELLVFTAIFLIVTLLWRNYRFFYLAYKIPSSSFDYSLKGIWNYLHANSENMLEFITSQTDGPLTKTVMSPFKIMVTIFSPENVKIVMNAKECFEKPSYLAKVTLLSKGTLFCNNDIWKSHRKILNPFFGIQSLRNLIPLFNQKTKILLQNLRREDGKGEFDAFNYMTASALETFLKTLEFDIDIQNQEETKRDSYSKNFKKMTAFGLYRIIRPWLLFDFIYHLTDNYKKETEARRKTGMFFSPQVIENVRNNMKTEKNNGENDDKLKSPMRALMNPENNLPEDELQEEVSTMILAAHDTSALVASSVLLMLGMHKDIQEKVHSELVKVLGKPSDDLYVDFNHVNELEYLEMVINESMRVIPVVPIIFRVNDEEIMSHEGYIIPAKTILYIPICYIHKNKKFWGEDADEFKPERFSKENFSKIHPYAFLPFTKGQRICIGWRYGMILMKIQLANILLNYKVDTNLKLNELRFQVSFTMNIAQGHQISIEKRKY